MFDFWYLPIMQWRLIDAGCFMAVSSGIVIVGALIVGFIQWYSLEKLREKQ